MLRYLYVFGAFAGGCWLIGRCLEVVLSGLVHVDESLHVNVLFVFFSHLFSSA